MLEAILPGISRIDGGVVALFLSLRYNVGIAAALPGGDGSGRQRDDCREAATDAEAPHPA